MIVFNHSGNIGDVLYSLNFAREFAAANGAGRFGMNLQKDVPLELQHDHPCGKLLMNDAACGFLRPLLEFQLYIVNVSVSATPPAGSVELSLFRKLPLYHSAGEVRYYYYALTPTPLPKDFASPMLTAPYDARAEGKIVIFRSLRYRNPLVNYKNLKSLADRMLFVGLPEEHEDFCRTQFPVAHQPVGNALELAGLLNSAKLSIGNQCGIFAIAEQLKVPRWLESCQVMRQGEGIAYGCPNVLPFGGKCRILIGPPSANDTEMF